MTNITTPRRKFREIIRNAEKRLLELDPNIRDVQSQLATYGNMPYHIRRTRAVKKEIDKLSGRIRDYYDTQMQREEEKKQLRKKIATAEVLFERYTSLLSTDPQVSRIKMANERGILEDNLVYKRALRMNDIDTIYKMKNRKLRERAYTELEKRAEAYESTLNRRKELTRRLRGDI